MQALIAADEAPGGVRPGKRFWEEFLGRVSGSSVRIGGARPGLRVGHRVRRGGSGGLHANRARAGKRARCSSVEPERLGASIFHGWYKRQEAFLDRIDPTALFGTRRPIVGMVHLRALPGAPRWGGSMNAVLEEARSDAAALLEGGVDGVLVENYGDVPFRASAVDAVTVAAMTRVVAMVAGLTDVPIGVNVLRNDALAALSIAVATGATFIRVNVHTGGLLTDQGWIEGRADETLRERERLGVGVAIFADVAVKHAVIPPGFDPAGAAADLWERGLADALIVTGPSTGRAPDADRLRAVRVAVPDARLWLGSGVTAENAADLLVDADGVIAGSALQHGGRAGSGVDVERVRTLVDSVRAIG